MEPRSASIEVMREETAEPEGPEGDAEGAAGMATFYDTGRRAKD